MNSIRIGLLSLLFVFIGAGFLSAQEKDFSSFEEMRSSFKESFDEKAVKVDVQEAPGMPNQGGYNPNWNSSPQQHKSTVKTNVNIGGGGGGNWLLSVIPLLLAIWVVWDASNIGAKAGQAPGFPDFGPVGWFFLTFCCWCIGFPFYLAKRSKYIEANKKNTNNQINQL